MTIRRIESAHPDFGNDAIGGPHGGVRARKRSIVDGTLQDGAHGVTHDSGACIGDTAIARRTGAAPTNGAGAQQQRREDGDAGASAPLHPCCHVVAPF